MRKQIGRNQMIAVGFYGAGLVFSGFLAVSGAVSGPEWLSFVQIFLPVAVGSTLGIGAVKDVLETKIGTSGTGGQPG